MVLPSTLLIYTPALIAQSSWPGLFNYRSWQLA